MSVTGGPDLDFQLRSHSRESPETDMGLSILGIDGAFSSQSHAGTAPVNAVMLTDISS